MRNLDDVEACGAMLRLCRGCSVDIELVIAFDVRVARLHGYRDIANGMCSRGVIRVTMRLVICTELLSNELSDLSYDNDYGATNIVVAKRTRSMVFGDLPPSEQDYFRDILKVLIHFFPKSGTSSLARSDQTPFSRSAIDLYFSSPLSTLFMPCQLLLPFDTSMHGTQS